MSIENGHPHQCQCGRCYTTSRSAAKCCKESCVDLRDGTTTVYCEEAALRAQAEDRDRWDAIYREHHCECSCGERFRAIESARSCRKCRTYTANGYCSEVYDCHTGKTVWELS